MGNRLAWMGCLSSAVTAMACSLAYAGGTPLTVELVESGLNHPLYVTHSPGDFDRIYIVEKRGTILVHNLVTTATSTFLDITARVGTTNALSTEQGLLGLAFHPDFATNSFFYVDYTDNAGNTVVSRYTATDSDHGDSTSESILLSIFQPQGNHNGGWLSFGPDGYLYISTGDGGNANDQGTGHTEPGGNGQDITAKLLGKILRIDVDGGSPYAIPPDNPFVGVTGDDEIWAYGLRNPWRNAFDRETGDLYIADVGQGTWEEINFQPSSSGGGENYGWRCREGAHDFDPSDSVCQAASGFVEPIHEYSHGGSPFRCSITGGEVYRGCAIPDLAGTYFFSDWCSANIWSFRYVGGSVTDFQDRTAELATGGVVNDITSFGLDAYGEMYICDHSTGDGRVYKIVSASGPQNDCNVNGTEDACDIASGASPDDNTNGIPDECEIAMTPLASTDGFLKNRYISFRPNNIVPAAFQVELATSLNHPGAQGSTWWVDVPNAKGIALLTNAPVTRNWTETEVHVTGCEIAPVATYNVRASVDDGGTFSPPLAIDTAHQPGGGKFWGDTVGSFDGTVWSPPQGIVNIADAVAIIKAWQVAPGAPPLPVVDVQPQTINRLVNINDVFAVLLAFQGRPYPYGCPADPCQDNLAMPCP